MRTTVLIVSCLLMILVGGCGEDPAEEFRAGAGGEAQRIPDGGLAVIAMPADPDVLNPLIYTTSYSGQVLVLLLDCLMEMGENFRYAPRIAERLEFSPDGLEITVHLRNWNWADGTPLDAEDVVSSLALFRDPRVASPRAGGRLANILDVTALDPATVRYRFREQRTDQVPTLGHYILPAHVTSQLDPAAVATWPLNILPPSNGMFIIEHWQRGEYVQLLRNENYPGVRPHLERVLFRIIPDETTRLLELETGGVDFVQNVPAQQAARLAGNPDLTVSRAAGRLVGMVYWNHERMMFRDRRVRKALSLAMDRRTFVEGLLAGFGRPAAGPLPPALWAHDPDVPADKYDPVAAAGLLDEAGWLDRDGDGVRERDGRRLSFTLLTRKGDPVRENGVSLIRQNLADVGVAVETRILEFSTVMDFVQAGEFDAYLGVFSARLSVDPSGLLASDSHDRWNYGHYASIRADSLMTAAMRQTDRASAYPIWSEFQRHCAEDQPMSFLYYPDEISAHNNRLQDVRPHVLSPINNIREWWIAPGRWRN